MRDFQITTELYHNSFITLQALILSFTEILPTSNLHLVLPLISKIGIFGLLVSDNGLSGIIHVCCPEKNMFSLKSIKMDGGPQSFLHNV